MYSSCLCNAWKNKSKHFNEKLLVILYIPPRATTSWKWLPLTSGWRWSTIYSPNFSQSKLYLAGTFCKRRQRLLFGGEGWRFYRGPFNTWPNLDVQCMYYVTQTGSSDRMELLVLWLKVACSHGCSKFSLNWSPIFWRVKETQSGSTLVKDHLP